MGVKHVQTATHDDGPDDGRVNPSWWNEDHDIGALLDALVDLAIIPESLPFFKADSTGGLTPLTEFFRALFAIADAPTLLATLGAAALASPTFIGTPTGPTAALNTNTSQLATMAALQAMRADLVASAPNTLNTLNEIAAALGNNPSFSTTILTALSNRLQFDAAQTLTSPQKAQAIANLALAAVAVSGAYSDLTGKPSFAAVATSGAYNDLTGKPSLAAVATSGAYSDLSGRPVVGTAANDLVQLDGSAKLPAVDGSQLTNVVAAGGLSYAVAQTISSPQQDQLRQNIGFMGGGGYVNLAAYSNGSNALNITADVVPLFDSAGHCVNVIGANLNLNMATTGANALDSGSVGTQGYYYFVIYNPTTNTVACLASASLSPTMPSGYTYKRRVGWFYYSSGILAFAQRNNAFAYRSARTVTSGANGGSYISLAGFAPPTASKIRGLGGSNNNNLLIGDNIGSLCVNVNAAPANVCWWPFDFIVQIGTFQIYYSCSSGGGSLEITGWEDNI